MMGLFRKKEKKEENNGGIPISYRITGMEFVELLFIITLLVMVVAWASNILLSLLFFLSVASLVVILVYGYGAMQKGSGFSPKMLIPLAGAMFFLAMSLSPNNVVFLVSAYGCAFFSPVLAYFILKREVGRSRELMEAFGDE